MDKLYNNNAHITIIIIIIYIKIIIVTENI